MTEIPFIRGPRTYTTACTCDSPFSGYHRMNCGVHGNDKDEMVCDRCGRWHGVVWFTDSDLWNKVMREGDRGKPDEFSFCCPECFIHLATARGIVDATGWELVPRLRGAS